MTMGVLLISHDAQQVGRGTDRFKAVTGLTRSEREHLRSGGDVFFRSQYLSGGNHGTHWRKVRFNRACGRYFYDPRVPSDEELVLLREEAAR
jgi:hypothetical protein